MSYDYAALIVNALLAQGQQYSADNQLRVHLQWER